MPGLVYRLGTQEDCDVVPALGKLIAEKHVNWGDSLLWKEPGRPLEGVPSWLSIKWKVEIG